MRHIHNSLAASRKGVALIITLSFIVLLTFVVVALLTKASSARRIEAASTSGTEAGEVARSAAAIIISDLQKEIEAGSSPKANGYRPTDSATLVPARTAGTAADSPLIKQSKASVSFFPTSSPYKPTPAPTISNNVTTSASTATASINQRVVPAARWSAPQLLAAAPPVPNWINITPSGLTSSLGTAANPVTGRFAFNVYDVGGLIDLSTMGSPAQSSAPAAADVPFKTAPMDADIFSILKDNNSSIMPWNSLLQWRYQAWKNSLLSDKSKWLGMRQSFEKNGGVLPLRIEGTDHVTHQFGNRQDLLNATTGNLPGPPPGPFFLPDPLRTAVTHALFERNAPALPYIDAQNLGFVLAEADRFSATYSSAKTLTYYRDDGTTYEVAVKAGDPVLQKRFSLGKLGRVKSYNGANPDYSYWLTPTGAGVGISPEAIKAVFGLVWDIDQERWIYVSPKPDRYENEDSISPGSYGGGSYPINPLTHSSAVATGIKTLKQVAAEGRPPDFFELLKAGINPNSLGGRQTNGGSSDDRLRQGNSDFHILRIGAAAIDQADNNNFPTRIFFDIGKYIEAAGIEDLPYLMGFTQKWIYDRKKNTATNFTFSNVKFFLTPIAFNPFRSSPALAASPSDIRINLKPGASATIVSSAGGATDANNGAPFLNPGVLTGGFPSGSKNLQQDFRLHPRTIGASTDWQSDANSYAFEIIGGDVDTPPNPNGRLNQRPIITYNDLEMALTFESPSGAPKRYTYDVLSSADGWGVKVDRIRNGPAMSTGTQDAQEQTVGSTISTANVVFPNGQPALAFRPDPRASRFGLFATYGAGGDETSFGLIPVTSGSSGWLRLEVIPNGSASGGTDDAKIFGIYDAVPPTTPFVFPGPPVPMNNVTEQPGSAGTYRQLRWYEVPLGGTTMGTDSLRNIAERPQDTTPRYRANNAFYGDAANPLKDEARLADTTSPTRPVILQRPFRNVAELGHVFRDQPWKSLNFFHESSADLALLDLFTVSGDEPEILAGRPNINSIAPATLNAILRGTGDELEADARSYKISLVSGTADPLGSKVDTALTAHPLLAEALKTKLESLQGDINTAFGPIKWEREGLARALAGLTQTRTWNLTIDVIAQSGRYPQGETNVTRFLVEGESRYWVHLALDRFTGKIVNIQYEKVNE